jgi:hypothetical protein
MSILEKAYGPTDKGEMMKSVLFVLLLITAIGTAGCSTVHTSQYASPVLATVDAHLKANVEVGPKIAGSSSSTTLFGIFTFGPNKFADGVNYGFETGGGFLNLDCFAAVKSAAAYQAVTNSNSDLIIAPKYTVEYNNYFIFSTKNATVSGYKGVLKGVEAK